jgi:hypothetical protein
MRRCGKRKECAKKRKPPGSNITHAHGSCGCGSPLPVPRHFQQTNCARCKKYGKPERRRKYANARRRRRRAKDKGYVLRQRLSCRLREMCSKRGIQKSNSITVYLGCTPAELMAHIERQFTDGMTWESYGVFGWHIDHHLPCAMFDLSREDHRHVCFHHSNLRPLWAPDNSLKQARLHNDIPADLKARAFAVGLLVL